ncbi:hypothetical protein [Lysobacter sp. Hz 25]|uniref:hypothetical protein n=1 Tax=Lysobacter sp. Hz 25 TaxID=3383698 RepID=UPI0038D4D36D
MKKWFLALAMIIVAVTPVYMLLRTDDVSEKKFKSLYIDSVEHAYSTWYLYEITGERLCFKYSRPIVPKRYCVPTSELSVKNGKEGNAATGFVTSKELFVRNPDGLETQIVVP